MVELAFLQAFDGRATSRVELGTIKGSFPLQSVRRCASREREMMSAVHPISRLSVCSPEVL